MLILADGAEIKASYNTPYEKVGDAEPVSIADEVPFDIPDTWEWVRLGSLIQLQSGQDLTPDKYNSNGEGIPYITGASNIEDGNVIINRWTKDGRAFAYCGDILLTCKGTVGTMAVLHEVEVHIARQIMGIRPYEAIYKEYVILTLETLVAQLKAAAKSMIPGIAREDVLSALIPLPPRSEQERIVAKYQQVLPVLQSYDSCYCELSALNAAFPDQLRKSILQLAVQGKLVPQDPSDEPASALLERIRAEKERLIAARKIKRDKHESVIFRRDNSHYEKQNGEESCIDDEIPFDIPDTWAWCRLREVLLRASTGPFGTMLHKDDYAADGVPLVNPANIVNQAISIQSIKYVSAATAERLSSYTLHSGDVIIGRRGEMGRSAVVQTINDGWLCGTGCFFVKTQVSLLPEYLVFLLASSYLQTVLMNQSIGTTMSNLNHNILSELLIPLPPVAEQRRIMDSYCEITCLLPS